MKISFVLIFLFLLPFNGSLLGQKSKTPSLNPRQIDFMNRLSDVFYSDDRAVDYFIVQCLGGDNVPSYEIDRKKAYGLRDPAILPKIIRKFKIRYAELKDDKYKIMALNSIFSSLTNEECHDLLYMTEDQIVALANKYSDYLIHNDAELEKLPKY